MNKYAQDINKLFTIFSDLFDEGEFYSEDDEMELNQEDLDITNEKELEDAKAVAHSLYKQRMVNDNISKYLKNGFNKLAKKRELMYYIFFTSFVFTKYNPQLDEDFTAKYPFLNDLYNDLAPMSIVKLLYQNRTLLTDLIEQYTTIEYFCNQESNHLKNELDKVVTYYMDQNPLPGTEEALLIPQVYQKIALDIALMHDLEELPSREISESVYNYLFIHPEQLPNILNISTEVITNNLAYFQDELTLYTYIYIKCKMNSLGISPYEQELIGYIREYLDGNNHDYTIAGDSNYMISKYIHVLSNKHVIMKYHQEDIDKALGLAKKKINPLSINCFKV